MASTKPEPSSALLLSLARFTAVVAEAAGANAAPGCYPVLGAEGSAFFVEISRGALPQRKILRTIHIEFEPVEDIDPASALNAETTIRLPNPAYLIALLSLLEAALKSGAQVLHPLDIAGNYLPRWNQAVSTVLGQPQHC